MKDLALAAIIVLLLFMLYPLAKIDATTTVISAQLSSLDPNSLVVKNAEIAELTRVNNAIDKRCYDTIKVLEKRNEELAQELKRKVAK